MATSAGDPKGPSRGRTVAVSDKCAQPTGEATERPIDYRRCERASPARPADEQPTSSMPHQGVDAIQMTDVLIRGSESSRADGPENHTLHRRFADVRAADEPREPGGTDDGRSGTAIITRTKPKTKRPSLYRVLLLNDDYTPQEFVVHVVEKFFNKSQEVAFQIMMHVHQNGVGECGIFTYEVAETKVTQVMDFARKHQHPLQCVMEKK
jgi:ATP-dependent Clp protease adaptor protein ClpS